MARAKTPKRHYLPDFKYNSVKVTRLTNYLMEDGKKKLAMRILYDSFQLIQEKENRDPLEVLEAAIAEIKPSVETKGRRVGGANLRVPIPVRAERQEQLWMRWLLKACKKRNEKTMSARIAYEIMSAAKGEGNAVKERKSTHKSADSHKAYSHLR